MLGMMSGMADVAISSSSSASSGINFGSPKSEDNQLVPIAVAIIGGFFTLAAALIPFLIVKNRRSGSSPRRRGNANQKIASTTNT